MRFNGFFEHFQNYTGDGSPIELPAVFYGQAVTLSAYPKSGTAKWQYTTYPKALVDAEDADVEWFDWDAGAVSSKTITAIMSRATFVKPIVSADADMGVSI